MKVTTHKRNIWLSIEKFALVKEKIKIHFRNELIHEHFGSWNGTRDAEPTLNNIRVK